MGTEQEIFSQVEAAVRIVLNTEEGEIKMETMFRADLDAESIDFPDINFL
ncbi:acyl carrier protein [bacterium BMS3Abin10]|nr:acyl carrier protein [bacterium BMS3Abin10]GBE38146.1 acyl carrier protein [bacterium BMS3Bbin08]